MQGNADTHRAAKALKALYAYAVIEGFQSNSQAARGQRLGACAHFAAKFALRACIRACHRRIFGNKVVNARDCDVWSDLGIVQNEGFRIPWSNLQSSQLKALCGNNCACAVLIRQLFFPEIGKLAKRTECNALNVKVAGDLRGNQLSVGCEIVGL